MKRTSDTFQLGELFSTNIYGQTSGKPIVEIPFQENSKDNLRSQVATLEKTKPTPLQVAKISELKKQISLLSRELHKEKKAIYTEQLERSPRIIFDSVTDDSQPLKAVIPYLTNDCIKLTMDNYRLYAAQKNQEVAEINEQIRKYNATVTQFKAANELTPVQIEYSRLFYVKNCNKKPKDFNALVENFNAEYGLLIEKQKHISLKYQTEIIFQHMLHLYSKQLTKYSNEFVKIGIAHETNIRQFEVNSHHLTNLERNGVKALNICNATIRNHRERLEEFGVLCHYVSQGNTKAVKMHINSQILVVFDAKTSKNVGAENQAFTSGLDKEFKDNNETTRAFKSNIKKKENGQADSLDLGTPSAGFSFVFYKDIPLQNKKSELGGGGENVKVSENLSEKLQNFILSDQELSTKLASGEFNNYNRLDKRYLFKEANYGTMSRENFKQLIVQEFFKNAARLYRSKNVFVGCWKKAINNYMEKMFVVNNGNGNFLYNKDLMVDKLDELLWRLNTAQKWFIKTKISPLYPSDYFDFTRTEAKEIGFEYTRKSWLNHLKYIETKPQLQQKTKKKAELRKKNINHSKKFDVALNRFFKNKIELPELIDYVDQNLPKEYLQKLSDRLLEISNTKYTC